MSGILMMVIAIVVLGGAYLLYGRYLQNKWGIDPKAKTPAYEFQDGVDSVARVGRLSFQEFFIDDDVDETNMNPILKLVTNKYFATILTLVLAYLLAKVGYAEIWPLFGSANQLLSVLALVACAVFLKKTKRQGCMLWIPMLFMMAVTFTALSMTIVKLSKAFMSTGLSLGNSLQLIFAVLLLILGVIVAIQGIQKLMEKPAKK
ncbi:MAG: carbon starvation CstA 5TM domain-containing protein [Lachnospiraceae bacterium]|nr:carbon starvation CstA 5TM domain-containing protein [Lachnospiraceae bacterium]